ncbi:protein of unknown function [Methylocaldum szegediense]|uniref:Uncharacterized protein n=1 Tax=Methylocaldum szegediense TaxID=73780 RepID=A0ABN8XC19_9GAMM|nr:protein of unknown function [Methylocaldum szegediense]CAI8916126.1 protein of unknown function [Methylocaldum szegediense]
MYIVQVVKELIVITQAMTPKRSRYSANRLRLITLDSLVEPGRIELPTSCVQGRRSPS